VKRRAQGSIHFDSKRQFSWEREQENIPVDSLNVKKQKA